MGGEVYTVDTLRPCVHQLPLEPSFQQLPDSPSTQKQSKGLFCHHLSWVPLIQFSKIDFLVLFYFETRFYYLALTDLNLAI